MPDAGAPADLPPLASVEVIGIRDGWLPGVFDAAQEIRKAGDVGGTASGRRILGESTEDEIGNRLGRSSNGYFAAGELVKAASRIRQRSIVVDDMWIVVTVNQVVGTCDRDP